MKRLSIRTGLAIFYTAVFAVVLAIFAALSYQLAAHRLRQEFDVRLDEVAAGLRGYLVFNSGRPSFVYDVQDRESRYFVELATRYLQVYDAADGRLLLESEGSRDARIALSPADAKRVFARVAGDKEEKYTRASEFDYLGSGGSRWRFHSAIVQDKQGYLYLLRVGSLMAPADVAVAEIGKTFLFLLPIGLVAGLFGGWWMARKALKPVDELQAVAHKIGISHLGSRLPLRGTNDELDRLAATFNEMFARLEAAVAQMKQFTAGIAHELRTPMSVVQGEAEITLMQGRTVEEYQRVLASQLVEFNKLNRMFDQLLLLARADAGDVPMASEIVDLAALAESLVDQMKLVAEDKNVALRLESDGPVEAIADASWLESVILNLVDNAIKFTPAFGKITVTAATRGTQAVLEVRDTGVGIPEHAIPHLFDRFFRVDAARSRDIPGVGLGLAIVKWAVEAQHGSISVESKPGEGSCFTVLLPRPESSASDDSPAALQVPADRQIRNF